MPNDLPMIGAVAEAGGRAVAVANAHPAVRAAAPELTSGHDVDGVARYLEAVVLDDGPSVSDWKPRLIASDMDGTLLRWDETVSDGDRRGAASAGGPTASRSCWPPAGRRAGCADIREVIGWGTAVCCNGAVLLDLERFEVLDEDLLQPDVLEAITTELRHRQPDTWFAVEYGMEFRHEPIYRPRWDIDAPGVAAATLDEMVQAPVAKLLARHEHLPRDDFVALVEDVVGDRATVTNSSSDALAEISAAGVTKASRAGEGRRAARRRAGGRRRLRRHAQRHRRLRVGPRRPAAARWPWSTRTPTCSPSPPTSPAPTTTTASPPSSPRSRPAPSGAGGPD